MALLPAVCIPWLCSTQVGYGGPNSRPRSPTAYLEWGSGPATKVGRPLRCFAGAIHVRIIPFCVLVLTRQRRNTQMMVYKSAAGILMRIAAVGVTGCNGGDRDHDRNNADGPRA